MYREMLPVRSFQNHFSIPNCDTMRFITLSLLLFFACPVFAQEQLGLRLENYAGVSSLPLNPAGNLTNPLKWDIQLVGAGLFFENNYTFLKNTGALDMYRRRDNLQFINAEDIEGTVPADAIVVDYFSDKSKRFAWSSVWLAGPSVAFRVRERHSFGVFTNLRYHFGSQNFPETFSYYKYTRRPFNDPFTVAPFSGSTMLWGELGLNYALKVPTASGSAGFGINVRFLRPYEGAFLENYGAFTYTKLAGDTVLMENPAGAYAYTGSNLHTTGRKLTNNGSGFALDLGYLHVFDEEEDGSYRLRLGASLLDLGRLKFNRNAFAHELRVNGSPDFALVDYEGFKDISELPQILKTFSAQATGDSTASFHSNEFKLALPAALSLQADYSFSPKFFANATFVHRLPTPNPAAPRGTLFALTPRFESRWLSASMPLSLYNWKNVNLGLAARLGFLVIGTDNITSILGKGKYTGTDFYIALKVNPFNLGEGFLSSGGGGGKRRYGNGKKVKCYWE